MQAAKRSFLPFEEARAIVRGEGLKNQVEWREWRKERRPPNIPSLPEKTYAGKGWVSFPDWLGYDKDKFLPFEEARAIVWGLELKSVKQWEEWCRERRPANIPSNPNITYKGKGWVSYPDWLGTSFLPFEEARSIVWGLELKNSEQWWEWSRERRPPNIPSHPEMTYKGKGWVSYPDWLGYSKRDTR